MLPICRHPLKCPSRPYRISTRGGSPTQWDEMPRKWRKVEEGTERTSRPAICLQERQWPVSRFYGVTRAAPWCLTCGQLKKGHPRGKMWSCKQAVSDGQCARTNVVTIVLSITNCCFGCYFLHWTGMFWWTSLLDVLTSKMCIRCTALLFVNKLTLL